MTSANENRKHARVDLLAQVQISSESEVLIMSTKNISRGGIFIQGDPLDFPELGQNILVELVIFAANDLSVDDVRLMAQVVRVEASNTTGTPPGFGLQFVQVDQQQAQCLDTLLSVLEKI
jgi:hypothetical protein